MRSRQALLCWSLAFFITGCFALHNISTWPNRLTYSGDESYEGVVLSEIVRLGQGQPIYADGNQHSFDAATYGPVYYLFGKHIVTIQNPSYLPLRLLSVIGMFGCAAVCGLLAFWISGDRLAAFLAALIFLSYGMVTDHGIQALSDAPALFLSALGFVVAHRFRATRALLWSVPLIVLGFYSKPQYVAGPVSVFVFLLLQRQWQRAAEFLTLLSVCLLTLFAYFQWVAFSGQAFWRHFLLYQSSLLSLTRLEEAILVYAIFFLSPLLLGISYLRTCHNQFISCYLAIAIVLGLLTYSKSASGVHYFFETTFILSTLFAVLFAKALSDESSRIEVLVLLACMLFTGQWSTKDAPARSDFAQYAAIEKYLRASFPPGAVSLGVAPGDLLQAGLQIPYSDLFTLTQLVHRGLISDGDLQTGINAHRFAVIVLYFDVKKERDPYWLNFYVSSGVLAAIQREYLLATSLDLPQPKRIRPQDRFYAYVPRLGGNMATGIAFANQVKQQQ